MFFPFYYNANEGKDHHYLWPLVKVSENRITRFVPFWFRGEEESFTFFPFLQQTPEYTLWFVPPMYFQEDGNFSAVIPLYLKNKNKLFVFPNILYEKGFGDSKKMNIYPLYGYEKNPNYESVSFAMISGTQWGDDISKTWFWPLYSKGEDPYENHLWLLPYFHKKTVNSSTTALYPFFFKHREPNSRTFWSLLYYERTSAYSSMTELFPFFGVKKSRKQGGEIEKFVWALWPVYSMNETISTDGNIIAKKRRWLIFSDDLKRNGSRSMGMLGIPIRETFPGRTVSNDRRLMTDGS